MYKHYTKEFKNEIIQRYLNKESVRNLSLETQVSKATIYQWLSNYQKEQTLPKKIANRTIEEKKIKIKKLETMLTIINDVGLSPLAPLKEKLYAMEPFYKKYNVHWLCEAMNVNRGTFYNHIFRGKHGNTWHVKQREILKAAIEKIYNENRQIYGATKITILLKQQGYHTCEKTVCSIMRELGISSIRQSSKSTYEATTRLEMKNRLNQQFQVVSPNQVWVSDVTQIKALNKNYYICVILDLYARKVVAYEVSENNSTQLVKRTLQQAYQHRHPQKPLMFHTDRGSNYCSKAFCEYLDSLKLIDRSFSRKGTPYDNAVIESFFSSLKREELYRINYRSEKDFLQSLDDYITFYNTQRPHSNNNYKSPEAKEQEYFSQK